MNSAKAKSGVVNSSGGEFMQAFFARVETVKVNISIVKEATREIGDINQNVVQATTNDREQEHSNKLGAKSLQDLI